jgi:gas vesicle protein
MKNETKLIVGLLAGAAAIAAVGLLLSTDKGSDIKEELTDYLADIIKSVKSKATDTAGKVSDLTDSAIKTAKSAVQGKTGDVADSIS